MTTDTAFSRARQQRAISWEPSTELLVRAVVIFAVVAGIIGGIGFADSFRSVSAAARPFVHSASWSIPLMVDLAIFVLSGLALILELFEIGARWLRWIPNALAAGTLYLNTATQPTWFGRAVHAVGPLLWIIMVEIATFAVRRLVGLSDERRIERLRRSLWLLRPVATWRIWRQMRVSQITSYAEALDRDAARAAVVGRLRLHYGRLWRSRAPLAERIALRLDGRDPAGVGVVLADHQTTAALLAAVHLSADPSGPDLAVDRVETPDPSGDAGLNPSRTSGSARPDSSTTPDGPADPEQAELADLLKAAEAVPLHRGARSATRISSELEVSANLAKHLATMLTSQDEITKLRAGSRSARSHEVLLEQARAEFTGQETPTAEAIRRAIGCRAATARKLRDDLAAMAEANQGLVPAAGLAPTDDQGEGRPADSTEPGGDVVHIAVIGLVPQTGQEPTEDTDDDGPDAADESTDLAA